MKLTPNEFMELLRVLNCMSLDEFYAMFERTAETDAGDYILGKYNKMHRNMFEWLADLDSGSLNMVFKYANNS